MDSNPYSSPISARDWDGDRTIHVSTWLRYYCLVCFWCTLAFLLFVSALLAFAPSEVRAIGFKDLPWADQLSLLLQLDPLWAAGPALVIGLFAAWGLRQFYGQSDGRRALLRGAYLYFGWCLLVLADAIYLYLRGPIEVVTNPSIDARTSHVFDLQLLSILVFRQFILGLPCVAGIIALMAFVLAQRTRRRTDAYSATQVSG